MTDASAAAPGTRDVLRALRQPKVLAMLLLGFSSGLPLALSVILAAATMFGLGLLTERFLLRRMVGQPIIMIVMLTLGLDIFLRGLGPGLLGAAPKSLDIGISLAPILLGDVFVNRAYLVGGIVAILVVFWALFQTGQEWVSVAFYILGLIFAILLVSQFWSLANAIYNARQAKRLFGFIGGGTTLGGMTGAGITSLIATEVGTNNLLLFSAGALALCILIVIAVLRREGHAVAGAGGEEDEARADSQLPQPALVAAARGEDLGLPLG